MCRDMCWASMCNHTRQGSTFNMCWLRKCCISIGHLKHLPARNSYPMLRAVMWYIVAGVQTCRSHLWPVWVQGMIAGNMFLHDASACLLWMLIAGTCGFECIDRHTVTCTPVTWTCGVIQVWQWWQQNAFIVKNYKRHRSQKPCQSPLLHLQLTCALQNIVLAQFCCFLSCSRIFTTTRSMILSCHPDSVLIWRD